MYVSSPRFTILEKPPEADHISSWTGLALLMTKRFQPGLLALPTLDEQQRCDDFHSTLLTPPAEESTVDCHGLPAEAWGSAPTSPEDSDDSSDMYSPYGPPRRGGRFPPAHNRTPNWPPPGPHRTPNRPPPGHHRTPNRPPRGHHNRTPNRPPHPHPSRSPGPVDPRCGYWNGNDRLYGSSRETFLDGPNGEKFHQTHTIFERPVVRLPPQNTAPRSSLRRSGYSLKDLLPMDVTCSHQPFGQELYVARRSAPVPIPSLRDFNEYRPDQRRQGAEVGAQPEPFTIRPLRDYDEYSPDQRHHAAEVRAPHAPRPVMVPPPPQMVPAPVLPPQPVPVMVPPPPPIIVDTPLRSMWTKNIVPMLGQNTIVQQRTSPDAVAPSLLNSATRNSSRDSGFGDDTAARNTGVTPPDSVNGEMAGDRMSISPEPVAVTDAPEQLVAAVDDRQQARAQDVHQYEPEEPKPQLPPVPHLGQASKNNTANEPEVIDLCSSDEEGELTTTASSASQVAKGADHQAAQPEAPKLDKPAKRTYAENMALVQQHLIAETEAARQLGRKKAMQEHGPTSAAASTESIWGVAPAARPSISRQSSVASSFSSTSLSSSSTYASTKSSSSTFDYSRSRYRHARDRSRERRRYRRSRSRGGRSRSRSRRSSTTPQPKKWVQPSPPRRFKASPVRPRKVEKKKPEPSRRVRSRSPTIEKRKAGQPPKISDVFGNNDSDDEALLNRSITPPARIQINVKSSFRPR
ncbi:unnamed protein product, partial [Mesorhabditis spiculigera]